MGNFSPLHFCWIVVAGVSLAIITLIARAGKRRISLVLRSFDVHRTPRLSGQSLVKVVGRPGGIIAFVLTILQLQPQTTLMATDLGIEYEAASLYGQSRKFIPLCRVASLAAGIYKPVGYLIMAGFLFLLGAFFSVESGSSIPLVAASLIAALLLVGYFLSKSVFFEITSNAGVEISLCFHPGVIEGVPIDASKAIAAAEVIRDLILERSPGEYGSSTPIGAASHFSSCVAQPVSTAQSTQCSPPPFVENSAPVIAVATPTDNSHDEEKARETLREAVRLYKIGNRDAAATAMNHLINKFPNTMAAKTAQINLAKMRTEGA